MPCAIFEVLDGLPGPIQQWEIMAEPDLPHPPYPTPRIGVQPYPGSRVALDLTQAEREGCSPPCSLPSLPPLLPQLSLGPKSGAGNKGETISSMQGPLPLPYARTKAEPKRPWLRKRNWKNGFLMGMTIAWRWDESSEPAGGEGSEQKERAGPDPRVVGFSGREGGEVSSSEVLGFHNGEGLLSFFQ